MGDIVVAGYAVAAATGIALIVVGAARRARLPLVLGCGLLLALVGAWVLGLPGLALGILPIFFLKRR